VLFRTDSGGGTHEFLNWLTAEHRRAKYSVGFTITEDIQNAILQVPKNLWEQAYDADRIPRDAAWVAEVTVLTDLSAWPKACA